MCRPVKLSLQREALFVVEDVYSDLIALLDEVVRGDNDYLVFGDGDLGRHGLNEEKKVISG